MTVDRKGVSLLSNMTVHVSPSTVSRLYSPSQCPASLYTKTGEFGGRS
jgi:hypothetical protein